MAATAEGTVAGREAAEGAGLERRWNVLLAVVLGAAGFVVGWVATGPRLLALINWDNSAYVAGAASGRMPWSNTPWNNHYGVGHIYYVANGLSHALGGTTIDGFRFVEALFFGGACAVVGDTVRLLCGSRMLAVALTAAWAAAWANLFLIITLEYNVLFLLPAAAMLRLCMLRIDDWRLVDSVKAAVLVAGAVLISWQAGPYLATPVWAALIGRGRSVGRRLRDAAAVVAVFPLALSTWALYVGLTSQLGVRQALAILWSRPVPANIPNGLGGWIATARDTGARLHSIGASLAFQIGHTSYQLPSLGIKPETLAGFALGVEILVLLAATVWAVRRRDPRPHLIAATLLLLTAFTSMFRDVEYAYFKRYNFLPLLLTLLVAMAASGLRGRGPRLMVTVSFAVLALLEVSLALRWDQRRHASYAHMRSRLVRPHPESAWYGRDGKSWFAWFREVRRAHPDACRYLFALPEVEEGRWNFDIPASLWSELPAHLVVGDAKAVASWRYPPRMIAPEAAREQWLDRGCAWVSDDARLLLSQYPDAARK